MRTKLIPNTSAKGVSCEKKPITGEIASFTGLDAKDCKANVGYEFTTTTTKVRFGHWVTNNKSTVPRKPVAWEGGIIGAKYDSKSMEVF